MEIPRGRGTSKAQLFERKYDTKMEFPEGWGVQFKKPSMGGVWIFSGTTQCTPNDDDINHGDNDQIKPHAGHTLANITVNQGMQHWFTADIFENV